ncbi:MAG: hypothetical protein EOP09_11530, partial [Proteobacteria bacterium]
MAFWLVYQGNSWDRARKGGYLWAPKIGRRGQTQVYWSNMEKVQPGDLIFSGVDGAIRAICEVQLPAYGSDRPDPRDEQHWYGDGWRLDVDYTDLPQPLNYRDWVPAALGEMPTLHSPFHSGAKPNQGYLYALPNSVGTYIVQLVLQQDVNLILKASFALSRKERDTTRQQLVAARVGQGRFRKDLLERWGG